MAFVGIAVAAAVVLSPLRELAAADAAVAECAAATLLTRDPAGSVRAVEPAVNPVGVLFSDAGRPVRAGLDAVVLRPDDVGGPVTAGRDSVALWLDDVESPVDGSAWETAAPPTSEAQKPTLRAPAPSQTRWLPRVRSAGNCVRRFARCLPATIHPRLSIAQLLLRILQHRGVCRNPCKRRIAADYALCLPPTTFLCLPPVPTAADSALFRWPLSDAVGIGVGGVAPTETFGVVVVARVAPAAFAAGAAVPMLRAVPRDTARVSLLTPIALVGLANALMLMPGVVWVTVAAELKIDATMASGPGPLVAVLSEPKKFKARPNVVFGATPPTTATELFLPNQFWAAPTTPEVDTRLLPPNTLTAEVKMPDAATLPS